MNINRIKLRGFIGIRKGLGLEEIDLDMSDLKGLIAISGDTGAGKTTLMENLQPYAQIISRPNPALKNHVELRDSVRELDFTHNGQEIKTIIKIDSDSGRAEGYITVDGDSVVNGKISEYSKWIEDKLGSTNLFFNSVFCAQNSKKLSSLRPAELKALFAEFLGKRLEQLVQCESGAKAAIAWWTTRQNTLQGKMDHLSAAANDLRDAELNLESMETKVALMAKEVDCFGREIEEKSDELSEMVDNVQLNDKALKEKETCQREVDDAMKKVDDLQRERDLAEEAILKKIASVTKDISEKKYKLSEAESIKSAATSMKAAEAEIKNLEASLENTEREYDQLTAAWEKADKEAKAIYADLSREIELDAKRKSDHQKQINDLMGQRSDIQSKIKMLSDSPAILELKMTSRQAGIEAARLDTRGSDLHCGSCDAEFMCNSKNCEFIQSALKAQENLPRLKKALQEKLFERDKAIGIAEESLADVNLKLAADENNKRLLVPGSVTGEVERLRAESDKMKAVIDEITANGKEVAENISGIKREIKLLKSDRDKYKALADQMPKIAAVGAELAGLESMLTDLEQQAGALKASYKEKGYALGKEIAKLKLKCDSIYYDETLSRKFDDAKEHLETVKRDRAQLQQRLAVAEEQKKAADGRLELAKKAADDLQGLNVEMTGIVKEINQWSYIRDACSANGLRALEIDSVTPAIASDANKLLERALGSWAMVDFNTLDENGKEVLEPRVIDPDGDKVLIANRSGGQQVWALKAMRLAMTLISKEKSDRDYLTCYADEDDAGLDIETAKAYTKLYKEFMDFGGFSKCFFISHKPECVAMADHAIAVKPGKGVTIER